MKSDKGIVEREGRPFGDIFAERGEVYFRQAETSVIRQVMNSSSRCADVLSEPL